MTLPRGVRHVLHVDSNSERRSRTETALHAAGYDVGAAEDLGAVSRAGGEGDGMPDCVVLGGSISEVERALSSLSCDGSLDVAGAGVPVVVVLDDGGAGARPGAAVDARRRALRAGAQELLDACKLEPTDVAGAVENAIERHGAIAEEIARRQDLLAASEERYRAFIEQSSEGIWCFELDEPLPEDLSDERQVDFFYEHAYLAECNAEVARQYGYADPEDLLGTKLSGFLVPDDPRNRAYLLDFVRSNYRLVDRESREVDRHGCPRVFLNNLLGVRDESGRLLRAWGTQRDVTAREQAEEALRERSERLAMLYDSARTLLAAREPKAFLDSVYERLSAMLGLEVYVHFLVAADGAGLELAACHGIPEEDCRAIRRIAFGEAVCGLVAQCGVAAVIEDVQADTQERTALIRRLGLSVYVCHPLIARGNLVGTLSFGTRKAGVSLSEESIALIRAVCDQVAIAIDRKRAEDERQQLLESERAARGDAERANRSKDDFLATLSHELRSPLNAILGWTHLLRSGPNDPAKVARAIEVIERNARTQAQLISDLLDMSRITSGKLRLELQPVDLGLVIESALETVRPLAAARGLRIVSIVDPIDEPVTGDPARLEQVVWNLLSNAVKFTPAHGVVSVTVTREDSRARIVVSDTGRGIARSLLPHIFERFRQGDSSSSREHGGLGLGLALVRQLVELHGGKVSASSDGDGKGAAFTVELPLARPAPRMRDLRSSPPRSAVSESPPFQMPRLRGIKILVVDDEADARDLIKRVLEESEAEVVTAGSTDEALDVLARVDPHVVVSDIGMPGRDGYDLIATIRRSGRPVAAAALTAFARSEDRTRALFAGFNAHIAKPVEATELLATVASLVGRTAPAGCG